MLLTKGFLSITLSWYYNCISVFSNLNIYNRNKFSGIVLFPKLSIGLFPLKVCYI